MLHLVIDVLPQWHHVSRLRVSSFRLIRSVDTDTLPETRQSKSYGAAGDGLLKYGQFLTIMILISQSEEWKHSRCWFQGGWTACLGSAAETLCQVANY